MNVKNINFPENQYYKDVQIKTQIVLHHTVSDPMSPIGDINSWLSTPDRISTYIILGYDGTIYKCFKSNEWGHHLGIKAIDLKKLGFKDYNIRNTLLNKQSIGIEIDSWGGLTKKGDVFYNAYNKPIDKKLEIEEVDWRGYKYFQKYSDAQLKTLSELLPILMKEYSIDNYGLKDGNFDVRMDALNGKSGIFSHSNYRKDKSDLYPDKKLIEILKKI